MNSYFEKPPVLFPLFFALALFGYAFISFFPEYVGTESRVITVPYRAFICVFGLYIFLYWGVYKRRAVFNYGLIIFYLFWTIYLIRIFIDITRVPYQLGREPYEYILYGLFLSFFVSHVFFIDITRFSMRSLYKTAFILLVLTNFMGLIENIPNISSEFIRLGGNENLNPITYGMNAASLIITCVYLILFRKQFFSVPQFLLVIFILVGSVNLLLSISRSPMLGLGSCFLLLLIFTTRQGKKINLIMVLTVIVTVVYFIGYNKYQYIFENIFQKFNAIGQRQDQSSQERVLAFNGAVTQFLENPILGSHIEERVTQQYPHNTLLESFMAVGLVGGALFFLYWIRAIFSALYLLRYPEYGLVALYFFQIIVVTLFSGSLIFTTEFWYLSILVITTASQLKFKKQKEASEELQVSVS